MDGDVGADRKVEGSAILFVEVRIRVVSGMSAAVAVFVVVVYHDHLQVWPQRGALRGFETLGRLMKMLTIKITKVGIEEAL